jgi:DNA-directed RNA polymerase specialized sigma24 family protein
MITGSNCGCLVCRLEKSLCAELTEICPKNECGLLAADGGLLSAFPNPLDLVRKLHAHQDHQASASADRLLLELLSSDVNGAPPSLSQRLLLLAFIPTIHRTTSQIAIMFPSLARDDIAQHILTVFLEFLRSSELRMRRSHFAFTIARKLRRQGFRWAIRETRGTAPEEKDGGSAAKVVLETAEEPSYAKFFLEQFLDRCQTMGWLSADERELLVRFKIEGSTCQEIASSNGHGAIAVQHRIQRIIDRLRRLARRPQWQRAPEQLELFPLRVREKKHFAGTRSNFRFPG